MKTSTLGSTLNASRTTKTLKKIQTPESLDNKGTSLGVRYNVSKHTCCYSISKLEANGIPLIPQICAHQLPPNSSSRAHVGATPLDNVYKSTPTFMKGKDVYQTKAQMIIPLYKICLQVHFSGQ